jgi:transposase
MEELGFKQTAPKETGRPPYDPRDLLKLYIYGYLNRVRTSRMLERECGRNVELMWLMRKLGPDFKTIADFRKENRQSFKRVFRQFVLLCKGIGLLGGELVAVDGSKFKAVNSGQKNFSAKKLEKRLGEIDQKVERYLDEMERADQQDKAAQEITAAELKHKIEQLKQRKGKYEELLEKLKRSGEKQISLTDADSRAMALTPKGEVSYNVQTAVDSKHHLIVAQDVTNEGLDNHQLFSMAQGLRKSWVRMRSRWWRTWATTVMKNSRNVKRRGLERMCPNRSSRRIPRRGCTAKRNLFMSQSPTVISAPTESG